MDDFTASTTRVSRAHRPQVNIHTDVGTRAWCQLDFDQGLFALSISVEQARDLSAKLASALFDHDISEGQS